MEPYQAAKIRHLKESATKAGMMLNDDGDTFKLYRIAEGRKHYIGSSRFFPAIEKLFQKAKATK